MSLVKSNTFKNPQWPPTMEQIKTIASSALNQSQEKDIKVLVYWDNAELMIFDPIHFASTEYIRKAFKTSDRSILVIIGKQD